MQTRFFLRLVQRSLANRAGKWLTAILAVAMGASLVSASLSLAMGMRAKMSQALRSYGANILLVPAAGPAGGPETPGTTNLFAAVPEGVLGKLAELSRGLPLVGYAPLLYAVADIGSHRAALVGTWPEAARRVNPWWRVEGRWIEDATATTEALVGASMAQKLGLAPGALLPLGVQGRLSTFHVVGILSTGGSEDEQVLVTLRAAQELAGRAGQLSLIQVSALAGDGGIEAIARTLEQGLPGVAARTQLRLAMAEERLLTRLSLLLGLIAGLVLVASALGVGATMATGVLERTREIGLMKALGAGRRMVGRLFLVEAGAIGLTGGLLGGVGGLFLAQAIARSVFGGTMPLTPIPPLASIAMGICIAGLASLAPVRRAASVEPGIVLRGE
jgi:putative ABC transport system permease protein